MKNFFTLISLSVCFYSNAQVLCGTANENGTVTLTAPAGNVFTSIEFASYGTPNGSCGSFTLGTCHATNSVSVCSTAFVGQNSASINATNAVFGDPCAGTVKRLYIQARYSSLLPLKLISFTAEKTEQGAVRLAWQSDHEINTLHFVIERSVDGVLFDAAGLVGASGSGRNNYSFINPVINIEPTYYYRIKMVDIDGQYQYSNILRINSVSPTVSLSLYPNPATGLVSLTSSKRQELLITNMAGQRLMIILLIKGNQTINISAWPPGVYFMKTGDEVVKFIKSK